MNQEIPIFFSIDDNYIPCLGVAIHSLKKNLKKKNKFRIIVLNSEITEKSKEEIRQFEDEDFIIEFKDISKEISKLKEDLALRLRDYYSSTIYYRMFIPSLFTEYDKAIYIDSDVILQDDISNLYNKELNDNYVAAIRDEVVNGAEVFRKYSKIAIGIDPEYYFNSGVLLMNLKKMREDKIEEKFIYLLTKYNLDTVAPDQDYLNVLCKGKVLYLPETWDKMPDFGEKIEAEKIHLIHYNMFRKPWHYADVPYSECFWKYAKETQYYETLMQERENYTKEQKENDQLGAVKLAEYAERITKQDLKFVDVEHEINNPNFKLD